MKGTILRETFDHNLNQLIRLKQLENGNIVFTTVPKGKCKDVTSLSKPLFAHIRVTQSCNLNCPYCYAQDGTDNIDLSFTEMNKIIDLCNSNDIMGITWTGGEPFVKEYFSDMIKKTYRYNIRQTILTNGTLLKKVLETQIPTDNIFFQISLNNIWNDFHSNDQVFENIKLLQKNGYQILVTVMLKPTDIKEYEKIILKLIEQGAPSVRFGFEIHVGGAKNDNIIKYRSSLKQMLPDLIDLREKYKQFIHINYQFDTLSFVYTGIPKRFLNCEAGTMELYIDNNGNAYPCPLLKSYSEFYCGNILVDSWADIWNAPPMQNLREISSCSGCKNNCRVWCRALKYAEDKNLNGKSYYCLKEFHTKNN